MVPSCISQVPEEDIYLEMISTSMEVELATCLRVVICMLMVVAKGGFVIMGMCTLMAAPGEKCRLACQTWRIKCISFLLYTESVFTESLR